MKTTEFMARYNVTGRAEHLADVLADTSTGPAERRRFNVTFSYPGQGGVTRTETFLYETNRHETAAHLCLADALWTVSETAFYGQSYECLTDQFGPDVAISPQQWEQREHATRLQCESWITDLRMWEDFLHLEPDIEPDISDIASAPSGAAHDAARDADVRRDEPRGIDALYEMLDNTSPPVAADLDAADGAR